MLFKKRHKQYLLNHVSLDTSTDHCHEQLYKEHYIK